ncbi:hypothetical protein M413DRAFT_450117 [Hebeloma cylindrosporum]|uniref:Uncharacterized protein n=1 Tax=Hebeloma cylindrosporum TaxID=76867 RepID=A0A0C2X9J0_HEBCY|nr:hypothetical protein M413DRAFT_450117 [Hebeloma cylindrosporum h7]
MNQEPSYRSHRETAQGVYPLAVYGEPCESGVPGTSARYGERLLILGTMGNLDNICQ